MPLSDLFKKPAHREPVPDTPFGSLELQKKRYDAAVEFLEVLQKNLLSPAGRVHAGTALSVAAWMAGTSLYRSMNYRHNPPPGHIMLSAEVNDAWPGLISLFVQDCRRNGIELRSSRWATRIPEEHKPHMEILQAQERFQDLFNEIMRKHGLDFLEGARAGMIVCSTALQHYSVRVREIDLNAAAGMISMGVVTGAKTVPIPLSDPHAGPAAGGARPKEPVPDLLKSIAQNSMDGNGTRLVLGEGMKPMSESLHNGGKYILVHPEVTRKLEENNIDPFLIHEAALKMELTSRIPQIDFIEGDMNNHIQKWRGKPERQVPIHVRQLLWLKENAGRYGYVQMGNSWILK